MSVLGPEVFRAAARLFSGKKAIKAAIHEDDYFDGIEFGDLGDTLSDQEVTELRKMFRSFAGSLAIDFMTPSGELRISPEDDWGGANLILAWSIPDAIRETFNFADKGLIFSGNGKTGICGLRSALATLKENLLKALSDAEAMLDANPCANVANCDCQDE